MDFNRVKKFFCVYLLAKGIVISSLKTNLGDIAKVRFSTGYPTTP